MIRYILSLLSLSSATAIFAVPVKPEVFEVELKVSDGDSTHETKTRLALEPEHWTVVSGKRAGVTIITRKDAPSDYSCAGDDAILARYVPGVSSDGKQTLRVEFLVIDTGTDKLIQAAPTVIIFPGHSATLEQKPIEPEKSSTVILKVVHQPYSG